MSFPFVLADNSKRGLAGYEWGNISAVKNARGHSNMGNVYFKEGKYVAALKEYQIAYNLTSELPVSSTYLYNISRCFMKVNNYALAKNALLGAIEKECMNITYYKALVDCYILLGEDRQELSKYLSDYSNPYNRIVAGLIYLKTGDNLSAKIIFDEFISDNPDMLITNDIKAILRSL